MYLPVRDKPSSSAGYLDVAVVPNLINKEMAEELKKFAVRSEYSGWHRRGSKSEYVQASFFTCLVFEHNAPIYSALDYAWKQYIVETKADITFLEPYELKAYGVNDKFGLHNDILLSDSGEVERKINLIIQLSDENDYEGGNLWVGNKRYPRSLGTGVFFHAKYSHLVSEVTRGERFSLIGHAWGPLSK